RANIEKRNQEDLLWLAIKHGLVSDTRKKNQMNQKWLKDFIFSYFSSCIPNGSQLSSIYKPRMDRLKNATDASPAKQLERLMQSGCEIAMSELHAGLQHRMENIIGVVMNSSLPGEPVSVNLSGFTVL